MRESYIRPTQMHFFLEVAKCCVFTERPRAASEPPRQRAGQCSRVPGAPQNRDSRLRTLFAEDDDRTADFTSGQGKPVARLLAAIRIRFRWVSDHSLLLLLLLQNFFVLCTT